MTCDYSIANLLIAIQPMVTNIVVTMTCSTNNNTTTMTVAVSSNDTTARQAAVRELSSAFERINNEVVGEASSDLSSDR